MSVGDALDALRGLVADAASGKKVDLRTALDSAEFEQADVSTVPGEETLDHVRVRLASPVSVAQLEERFGPAKPLPRRPSGGSKRTVMFGSTLPGEGESGATVLADVGDDGKIRTIIVRADTF